MNKKNLKLNKVVNVKDFETEEFREILNEFNFWGVSDIRNADISFFDRKVWEMIMVINSFKKLNVLNPNSELLGVGVAVEDTIAMLSNSVKRIFATDIYLDGGVWNYLFKPDVLIDARPYMNKYYNHRKVVWQHVDARELPYEDNSFDGVFSCSSIEHFGNESDIRKSIEEIHRVLKPNGVAAISTEFKISGDGDGPWSNVQLFDRDRLEKVWLDGLSWVCADPLDLELDETSFIDFEKRETDPQYKEKAFPFIKLETNHYKWTSIHLTLIKK